jgi:hypothetical protein
MFSCKKSRIFFKKNSALCKSEKTSILLLMYERIYFCTTVKPLPIIALPMSIKNNLQKVLRVRIIENRLDLPK